MMRYERCSSGPSTTSLFCLLFLALALLNSTLAYQNYTVGDDIGWTFPTKNVIDYQKWSTGKNFSLGDFLIFNYPQQEHNVILTYNESVYKACDFEDSNDSDYEVWGQVGNSTASSVPLVQTGMNYFFCGANSSIYCENGMKFAINVTHGEGLPASLMIPPPAPTDDNTDNPSPDTGSPATDTTNGTPSGDNLSPTNNHGFSLRVKFLTPLLFPSIILAGVLL